MNDATNPESRLEPIRTLLDRAAALEVEAALAAAATYMTYHMPLRRLSLFEFRCESGDLREAGVWSDGELIRPRGRMSIDGQRLAEIVRWSETSPPASLIPVHGYVWDFLHLGEEEPIIAFLRVEDAVCGLVGASLRGSSADALPQLPEALIPLGIVLAHKRSQQLTSALEATLERTQRQANGRVRVGTDQSDVVGSDRGLAPVMHRVRLVQASALPVLLLGETGSGKEVIAREVHAGSPRADAPFVRVNCGAIPAALIDSALFGHERGSFTGANQRHKGWFERADGGTLFLDEIGELPLPAQVRLLRVLQDGVIERVGGLEPIHIDCRIIAATHRDLPGMVEEGTFREDLWFRLSAFPIEIPPLRERPQDIPALARFFAARTARLGIPVCAPTPEDLALLMHYAWPGNVRELGMVIDRAAILGQGKRLEIAAALGSPRAGGNGLHRIAPPPRLQPVREPAIEAVAPHATDSMSLQDAMRHHIESALSAAHGRVEGPRGAADLLGINPHTLRSRMRKLGIEWSRFRRES